MSTIIAISGPIAVGKSCFCNVLTRRFGAVRISTRQLLLDLGTPDDRAALIAKGNELDEMTNGAWVAAHVKDVMRDMQNPVLVLVDAVRKESQIQRRVIQRTASIGG